MTDIVKVGAEGQPIVRVAGNVIEAFNDYQALQQGLDAAMPDALMTIQGRKFRKKAYWRAVARAFNLSVEQVSEGVVGAMDEQMKWGYTAVYRATAPNGAHADGDGTCMAKEKWSKKEHERGGSGWSQATVHNVRSHAHTRAFNRAVSNLVGFGEVSAEEVEHEDGTQGGAPENGRHESRPAQEKPRQEAQGASGPVISPAQAGRLYAIAMTSGKRLGIGKDDTDDRLRAFLESKGYLHSKDIVRSDYDAICKAVESWTA